jgi:glyoxylase-like metal-dependent hydrolase (beta-lactamase superfamily II)
LRFFSGVLANAFPDSELGYTATGSEVHEGPSQTHVAKNSQTTWIAIAEISSYAAYADFSERLHRCGFTEENTKARMAEPHDSALLGLHIPASPVDALPQQTFSSSQKLQANGETVMLQYFQPPHTDTDIDIHFQKANVIHMGDTFFNGFYPSSTPAPGKVNGMIVAADIIRALADNNTKIVPGHGPLGNKADLTKSRDMLVVARDRVQKLKTAGKSRRANLWRIWTPSGAT